MSKQKIISN